MLKKSGMLNMSILISQGIALVGGILMAISLFIPYVVADNYRGDSISMVTAASVYPHAAALYVIIAILLGLFTLAILVFSVLRKPILILIPNLLAVGLFALECWDYTDRRVVGYTAAWGGAFYLFIIAAAIIFGGAIWLLINKIKNKNNK